MTCYSSSMQLEKSALGCILERSSLVSQISCLRPKEFSNSSNALIFHRMQAMTQAGQTIDLTILVAQLEAHNELDRVGGVEYIASLVDGCVPENLKAYVKGIKEAYNRRSLIHSCHAVANHSENLSIPTEEVVAEVENISADYTEEVAAQHKLVFMTAAEVANHTLSSIDWISRPWVAKGGITEVSGKIKAAGKTTWVTHMVKAVLNGAPFMGSPTTKSPVVHLTEQSHATFRVATARAGLLESSDLSILFWNVTVGRKWPEIVNAAADECKRLGANLLVIDTIFQFANLLGDSENNSGDALEAMRPLQLATNHGLGVVVVRHERKGGGEVGESGRGSTAFGGAVDVVVSIRRCEGNARPSLRSILSLSRFNETPSELTVDLTSEGYVIQDREKITAQQVNAILTSAPTAEAGAVSIDVLSTKAGLKRSTFQELVKELLANGLLFRKGRGKRNSPYQYWREQNISAGTSTYDRQKEYSIMENPDTTTTVSNYPAGDIRFAARLCGY
jgi:hypothetical protein